MLLKARFNIINMPVLSKIIYELGVIPIKTEVIYYEFDKLILEFIRKRECLTIVRKFE